MTEFAEERRRDSREHPEAMIGRDFAPGPGASGRTKLVSVMITAYERVHYLRLALESVLCQTYDNLEIYVFDNSESDSVRDLVEELADLRIRYIRNHMNLGYLANMRRAFSSACGDYFYMLSSDVMMHPQTIEKMVAFLEAHSSIPFVHSRRARRYLEKGIDEERPDTFVEHGLIEDSTGPYSTQQIIDYCLTRKPLNSFSPYESLIVTDFFVNNDIGMPIPGWNAAEYYYMLKFMIHTEEAGYISEVLKYNIIHKERYVPSKRERIDYYIFERIKYMKDFVDTYWNDLALRKFNLVKIRFALAGKFLAFGCRPGALSIESLILFFEIVLKLVPALVLRVGLLPITLLMTLGSYLRRNVRKAVPR